MKTNPLTHSGPESPDRILAGVARILIDRGRKFREKPQNENTTSALPLDEDALVVKNSTSQERSA